MNNKKVLALIAIVAIIAIIAYFFPTGRTVVERVTEKLGAVSTLDGVDNPYVKIGGAEFYYYSQAMTATSSTPCSLKNPFGSPAAILSYGASATTTPTAAGGMDAKLWTVATSTTYNGTSSPALVKDFSAPITPGFTRWAMSWLPQASTTSVLLVGM